jgi:glycosyltransferase involved in cell wall biosynthesis
MPAVSVILPFRNAELTLRRAMQSIIEQSFTDIELIAVDNCSADSSFALASSLAAQDSRIKLVTCRQPGVSAASQAGLGAASGRYISRMDADDWAHPDKLRKQMELFGHQSKPQIVACMAEHVCSPGLESAGMQEYVRWCNTLISNSDIYKSRFIESPVINPTAVVCRELIDKHGYYRQGNFPEDYDLWLRYMQAGAKFAKLPEVLFSWHDSGTRLTRTGPAYSTEAFYSTKAHYLAQMLAQQGLCPRLRILGAGRLSRKRAQLLEKHGLQIHGYIDVSANLRPYTIHYKDMERESGEIVLSYVANRGARAEIREFMSGLGYTEGLDFFCLA